MRWLFNLACVTFYLLGVYFATNYGVNNLLYMFSHVSLIHLSLNLISFNSIYKRLTPIYGKFLFIIFYFICVITSFQSSKTIGCSAGVYGLMGMWTMVEENSTIKSRLIFSTVVSLISGYFIIGVNYRIHILGLLWGLFFGLLVHVRRLYECD